MWKVRLQTPSSHTKHTAPSVLSSHSVPPPLLPLFSLSLLFPQSSLLPSSALAPIQWVPTYYIYIPHPEWHRKTQVLHSLALFTQTKSYSVSVTKPAKSLWLFHVLSAHGSLLSPGHWPGPWIQWARGEWRQIEGMRLNKPNYDMMTALTMVGVFQRSRAYSISPFQDPLSPNKVIPLTVCIAEWNACVCACMRAIVCTCMCVRTQGRPKWKCIGPQQGSSVLSG